jgi:hypothetical protein
LARVFLIDLGKLAFVNGQRDRELSEDQASQNPSNPTPPSAGILVRNRQGQSGRVGQERLLRFPRRGVAITRLF